jgi:hypothetical protein
MTVFSDILHDSKIPAQFAEQAKNLEREVIEKKLTDALENRVEKSKLEGQNIIHAGSPDQQAKADALKMKLAQNTLKKALADRQTSVCVFLFFFPKIILSDCVFRVQLQLQFQLQLELKKAEKKKYYLYSSLVPWICFFLSFFLSFSFSF